MMRPPRPCRRITRAAARLRKNAALRLTSCWRSQSSSVTSSIAGAADQDRRGLDQHVEPAEGLGDPLDHRLVLVDAAKVHADGEMRPARQLRDHRVDRRLVDDRPRPPVRPGRGEGARPPRGRCRRRRRRPPRPCPRARLRLTTSSYRSSRRAVAAPVTPAAAPRCAPRRSTIAPRRGSACGPRSAG